MSLSAIFTIYWRLLGYPLSCFKGLLVDRVAFSLVETLVWIGLGSLGVLCLCIFTLGFTWLKTHSLLFKLLLIGPALLILMAMGQGAFPLSLSPTAWRQPLAVVFYGPTLDYPSFKNELSEKEKHLNHFFSAEDYQSLSESEILNACDLALDQVLAHHHLSPGRRVRTIKPMGVLTTTLGLAYGGPAFHDPFLGELAMVRYGDMPTPRYWRLIGICHEAAHAKGFTREMDAEILTQLALTNSPDPKLQVLGDIMYLRKSGEKFSYPEYLNNERKASRDSLQAVEKNQYVVHLLRQITKKIGFQNSGEKYGSRSGADAWNIHHPFFATVAGMQKPEN